MLEIGQLERTYTARGLERFQVEIRHAGLNQFQVIRGSDPYVVSEKAEAKAAQWQERWMKQQEKQRRAQLAADRAQHAAERAQLALDLTEEARAAQTQIEMILSDTLDVDDAIDWSELKRQEPFPEVPPKQARLPRKPAKPSVPVKPEQTDFEPVFGLLDKIFSRRRQRKMEEAERSFSEAREEWVAVCRLKEDQHKAAILQWEQECAARKSKHEADERDFQARRFAYVCKQKEHNNAVNAMAARYKSKEPGAIEDYCDMVLSASVYPDYIPQKFELQYNPDTKIVVVEFCLPAPGDLPVLKEVRYVKSRDEMQESQIAKAQIAKNYDSVVYQLCIRTIHELFEADVIDALSAVTFNGLVTAVDPATGHEVTSCIVSAQAEKEEFLAINLAAVDPKACFKKLKGVGSSKLHSVIAVAPIMQIERDDKRFTEAYEVASTLDEGENLAVMDWEDFEHLIREIFEREFGREGSEVRVTRASRDGGIDAVIFDPDPLRGGKIVIQAKRYTKTVGVAAVRDLYGSLMNEGANKGILVTTASYGPDAYEFARGKPISLLDGGNLLHLMHKHGHNVRIDLKEAREVRS